MPGEIHQRNSSKETHLRNCQGTYGVRARACKAGNEEVKLDIFPASTPSNRGLQLTPRPFSPSNHLYSGAQWGLRECQHQVDPMILLS